MPEPGSRFAKYFHFFLRQSPQLSTNPLQANMDFALLGLRATVYSKCLRPLLFIEANLPGGELTLE